MRDRDRSGRYARPDNPMEWLAVGVLLGVGVLLVIAPTWLAHREASLPPAPPAVTVTTMPTLGTLPACDDDAPGRPVTGPCWLMDDGGMAVWPYPYAPTPVAVMGGWTP